MKTLKLSILLFGFCALSSQAADISIDLTTKVQVKGDPVSLSEMATKNLKKYILDDYTVVLEGRNKNAQELKKIEKRIKDSGYEVEENSWNIQWVETPLKLSLKEAQELTALKNNIRARLKIKYYVDDQIGWGNLIAHKLYYLIPGLSCEYQAGFSKDNKIKLKLEKLDGIMTDHNKVVTSNEFSDLFKKFCATKLDANKVKNYLSKKEIPINDYIQVKQPLKQMIKSALVKCSADESLVTTTRKDIIGEEGQFLNLTAPALNATKTIGNREK